MSRLPSIAIVGGGSARTAYASINRRWCEGLRGSGLDVQLVSSLAELPGRSFDCIVHHDYEAHFGDLARPRTGRFIAVRTWDFGPYPSRWAEVVRKVFDELWVHSRWTADQAVAGGVDPSKVHVVPHGVDTSVMTPQGPRSTVPSPSEESAGRFTFLFVGAAVARKGVDILLDAYGRAFDAADPVTLVIKDHTSDAFYQGVGLGGAVEDLRARERAPQVVYVDEYLDETSLAALFRGGDVCVFPFRAEGFAMPILEGMACGTPAIVPRFGPCLDFCDDDSAFFVAARRIRLPVARNMQFNTLGFREDVDEVDFCEVDPNVLAAEMRRVAATPAGERAGVSHAAVNRARAFSWQAAIDRVRERLLA